MQSSLKELKLEFALQNIEVLSRKWTIWRINQKF